MAEERTTTGEPRERTPAEKREGYDPAQRAEILETEGTHPVDNTLITEIEPDRGQRVGNPVPPEEGLHDAREGVGESVDEDEQDIDAALSEEERLDREKPER